MVIKRLTEADRKQETILEFLSREGWWQKKEEFARLINSEELKVNDKKIKVAYKPKKGDRVAFLGYSFLVDW
jgi:23S rRNA-/tRNA-specific pseudouridylate synthase